MASHFDPNWVKFDYCCSIIPLTEFLLDYWSKILIESHVFKKYALKCEAVPIEEQKLNFFFFFSFSPEGDELTCSVKRNSKHSSQSVLNHAEIAGFSFSFLKMLLNGGVYSFCQLPETNHLFLWFIYVKFSINFPSAPDQMDTNSFFSVTHFNDLIANILLLYKGCGSWITLDSWNTDALTYSVTICVYSITVLCSRLGKISNQTCMCYKFTTHKTSFALTLPYNQKKQRHWEKMSVVTNIPLWLKQGECLNSSVLLLYYFRPTSPQFSVISPPAVKVLQIRLNIWSLSTSLH